MPSLSSKLKHDQRRILEFIAFGEGWVLASEIAGALNLSRRGMGGRMGGLWQQGLVRKIVVKPAPSPRSDALIGWALTDAGREALT